MEVPQALKDKPHWVLWKNESGRKIPYQTNGQKAKSNDASTWTTFAAARASRNGHDGLGFVFDGSGVFGVDLDGCVDASGLVQPWATEIIGEFGSTTELSPSGTGVHIYGLGRLPGAGKKIKLSETQCCDKPPGVEVYDKGRYFAFTGRLLPGMPVEPQNSQEALDGLLERFWPAKITKHVNSPQPKTDVGERAARYLAAMPGAIAGCGGHNATFRAACVLVLGFGLSPEAAFPLLAEWNQRCEPAWTDRELWHKLHDANKKEGSRGWLLEGRGYEGADVNLQTLLAGLLMSETDEQPEPPEPIIRFPQECIDNMPWLMRLAYDYTIRQAIYPQPELTMSALIAMFGAIFGRKVKDDYETRTNVMLLGLSPSGSGKDGPRKAVKEILFHAGLDMLNGPERVGSHAGIISSINEQPSRLFQLDEIGRLLLTMQDPRASHLYNIGTVLMHLYTSSDSLWVGDAYADLNKVKRINQPCVCIFGTSVSASFYSGLTVESLSDGMLARMMVFESGGYGRRKKPNKGPVPPELLEGIKPWSTYPGGNLAMEHPDPLFVVKTDEADTRHEKYSNEVNGKHVTDNPEEAAIWARAPEKAAKLALIFACCQARQDPPQITIEAINWGRAIANYTTRLVLLRASHKVTASKWGAEKQRAWCKLVDGMTARDFLRKLHWLKRRDRDEILADWQESGAIKTEEIKTAGRSSLVIRKLRNEP